MKLRKIMNRFQNVKGKLAERHSLQRWFARKLLPFTQSLGFSVLGDHFYEPVPNLKYIRKHYIDGPRELPGFIINPDWAEEMERIVEPYIAEYLASSAFENTGNRTGTTWDGMQLTIIALSGQKNRAQLQRWAAGFPLGLQVWPSSGTPQMVIPES